MTITDNDRSVREIELILEEKMPIKLGINKKNELVRLIYENSRANNIAISDVIKQAGIHELVEDGKGELFHKVKKALLKMRYPSLGPYDDPHIMPVKIDPARRECPAWDFELNPHTIFIEKDVGSLKWARDFMQKFPGARVVNINSVKEAVKYMPAADDVSLYNSRNDRVFLVRTRSGLVKMCPCTKGYKRCGYWILNLGFGCPIDCSYCYLQMYSNAPGLILPANIEDYYEHIRQFDRKLKKRTRIGTGEFTDSLALDRYTGYSSHLIPFFRNTGKLVLELKTKAGEIDNVLREEPHENVVISWSMNTRTIAENYERGGVSITERINAAVRASRRGYRIGFHFDPVVYYNGWESEYKALVEELFSFDEVKRKTVWISLGTLRYAPGLKQVAERRFAENSMFYQGEFFMDTDGKLRYPRKVRIDMYNKMIGWIRSFGVSSWIYLCMEPEELWKKTDLKRSDYGYS
jgi:spore photoproduct lyase